MPNIAPRLVRVLLVAAGLVLAGALVADGARATFIMDPVVTFDGRSRDAAVRISNTRQRAVTYRIEVVNLRPGPRGQMVEAADAGPQDRFAKDFIRFSPRQVTLAPGEMQSVRLSLRKPADLPPGEYRTYLRITELPSAAPGPSGPMQVELLLSHQLPIIVKN